MRLEDLTDAQWEEIKAAGRARMRETAEFLATWDGQSPERTGKPLSSERVRELEAEVVVDYQKRQAAGR